MALTPGQRLAEYEIVAAIGAGGMGEVYQAHDTKLGREVAIKILPEAFSRDKDRLARFEREARLLASLNHPGIATLHGFERHDDLRFLVMELVEGETLEARLAQGPLSIDEAIAIFSHMAEALEAAHDKGVIHRDLKPANIKITPDGRPKILDFGLAKGYAKEAPGSKVSESPTRLRQGYGEASPETSDGVILGTAPYMSPEQARGQAVDARADVWAFGCVLYEALTARRAFDGSSVADILAAIVRAEPRWERLPQKTPFTIRELLRRCLRKDARHRLRHMGDAWIALEEARTEDPRELTMERRPKALVVTILIAVVATGLALWSFTHATEPPSRPVTITEISLPPGTELERNVTSAVAISPDGRLVAYVARRRGETRELYLRALDQMEATPIDKGQGASMPFFSPDGEWLGFESGKKLMKVSVSGGAAVTITEPKGSPFGASWGPEGNIVFNSDASNGGLSRVSADGGEVEVLTSPDPERLEKAFRFPDVLPGGEAVVFTPSTADIESFDDAPIAVSSLETGEYEVVVEGGTSPQYSPSGHLVYARGGSLLAVPFDLAELRVTGTPVPVLDGLSMRPTAGFADFSLSRNGTLLYAPGGAWGMPYRIVRVDRQGRSQPLDDTPRNYWHLNLSPDGSRLAITMDGANMSLWVYDLGRSSMSRVAFGWNNSNPSWSPDGRQITFSSNRSGVHNLYQMAADGSGPTERLSPSDHLQAAPSWSPDGTALVFINHVENDDIWWLPMDGDRNPRPFLQSEFRERRPTFSPNGRWLAYDSNESGRTEVYIRPFPPSSGRWQVSTGGGRGPRWNPNGEEIFYRNGDAMMAVVVVETEEGLTLGSTTKLFDQSSRDWDVDGQGFVMAVPGERSPAPTRLILVQNFGEELKRLVPTDN